jgi:hypothetical protein
MLLETLYFRTKELEGGSVLRTFGRDSTTNEGEGELRAGPDEAEIERELEGCQSGSGL